MGRLNVYLALALLLIGCGSGDAAGGDAGAGGGSVDGGNGPGPFVDGAVEAGPRPRGEGGAGDAGGVDAAVPCGAVGQACCADFACNAGASCVGASCAPAVTAYACPAGAPQSVFVGEVAPPMQLSPWDDVLADVTFANCSGTAWTTAASFRLGFAAPHDDDTWGTGRIALPADVQPGQQVTIAISVHAPPLTGPYGYAWSILQEGVAWIDQASPLHVVDVEAAAKTAPLCPGVTGDIGGGASALSGVQQCIDQTPSGGTLELPAGIYRIDGEIHLDKALTVRTAGTAGSGVGCLDNGGPPCAAFRADDNVNTPRGFIRFGQGPVSGVTLDHVILDGNRAKRLSSAAAAQCAMGNNGPGMNLSTGGAACTGCSFLNSVSARALCGTGFEWDGDQLTVKNSFFRDNGDHNTNNMWSDGLTVHASNGAVIDHNRFRDNSDVDFISGGGQNASYTNNSVEQHFQPSFAGIMLDNFNGATPGDFTGTMVAGNTVECHWQLCDFALELGPHPWYLSANIIGGTVVNNSLNGGKFDINVEGGGTAAAPIVLGNNTVGAVPGSDGFGCGVRAATAFNVSPDSNVVAQGGGPTGAFYFHGCP